MKRMLNKFLLLTILLIPVAGCVTMQLPGETIANSKLQYDTLSLVINVDRMISMQKGKEECMYRKIVNTVVIEKPKDVRMESGRSIRGNWVEHWTLDRCGTLVLYRIEFTYDEKTGGTYFRVRFEKYTGGKDFNKPSRR